MAFQPAAPSVSPAGTPSAASTCTSAALACAVFRLPPAVSAAKATVPFSASVSKTDSVVSGTALADGFSVGAAVGTAVGSTTSLLEAGTLEEPDAMQAHSDRHSAAAVKQAKKVFIVNLSFCSVYSFMGKIATCSFVQFGVQ